MEIERAVPDFYLQRFSSYVLDLDGQVPEDLSAYDDEIDDIVVGATRHNDLEHLRLAVDYLLLHPDIPLAERYMNLNYEYEEDEARELLAYFRQKAWPDLPPPDPEEVKDVRIVDTMMISEWWEQRTRQGLHPDFSKQPPYNA